MEDEACRASGCVYRACQGLQITGIGSNQNKGGKVRYCSDGRINAGCVALSPIRAN